MPRGVAVSRLGMVNPRPASPYFNFVWHELADGTFEVERRAESAEGAPEQLDGARRMPELDSGHIARMPADPAGELGAAEVRDDGAEGFLDCHARESGPTCKPVSSKPCNFQQVRAVKHNAGMKSPLAEHILKFRAGQKMKQKDLAGLLELDQGYLSKIEKGTHTPSVDVLGRIAHAIGATMDELTSRDAGLAEPIAAYATQSVSRAAIPGMKVGGLICIPGDVLVFEAGREPRQRDAILCRVKGVEAVGIFADHPSTGDELVWLPDGSQAAFEDVDLIGVAVAFQRPLSQD